MKSSLKGQHPSGVNFSRSASVEKLSFRLLVLVEVGLWFKHKTGR